MSYTAVTFQGWGLSNLEDIIEEIAQSPTPLTQEEIFEDLDAFVLTFFDKMSSGIDQNVKYLFLDADVANLNTTTPATEYGVSFYVPYKLAMALQVSYDIIVDQLAAAIEEYIHFSTLFSLKQNADVDAFVKKHYSELNVNSILY